MDGLTHLAGEMMALTTTLSCEEPEIIKISQQNPTEGI